MDRLSRSVLDFARILRRAEDGGWGIVVLDLGVDMTTPKGRLVAHVLERTHRQAGAGATDPEGAADSGSDS
jgi:DNA invertase Pin-like site-specific DNA recombinase